jgi:phosphatidate cytidylyltransferase
VLKQRVITAVFLLLALIAVITLLSSFYFSIVIALITLLAAWEWGALLGLQAGAAKLNYLLSIAAMLIGCFLILGITPDAQSIAHMRAGMILFLGLLFWLASLSPLAAYPDNSSRWNDASKMALMGVLALVPAFVGVVTLKYLMPSGYLVLALVILVAAVDVGAYFAGVNFGSKKLAAKLSPNKTWEGVWGGMTLCFLISIAFVFLLHRYITPLALTEIIILLTLSIGITFFGIVGDLIESMLKRNRGVKDSGALLPGHGGILDRVDGLIAVTPLFALVMMLVLSSDS